MDINGYQWISMDINGYQWYLVLVAPIPLALISGKVNPTSLVTLELFLLSSPPAVLNRKLDNVTFSKR